MKIIMLTMLGVFLTTPGYSASYAEMDSVAGGRLYGTVTMRAPHPKAAEVVVNRDMAFCGETVTDKTYVVSPEGQMANVVVYLSDIKRGRKIDTPVYVLEHKWCQFSPHVMAVPKGSLLWLRNDDRILHTAHAYMGERTVFNTALPPTGAQIPKVLNKPGIMKITCDSGHAWMSAWIFVAEHPYVTVTDAKGRFFLSDIPPGNYTVKTWHEAAGEQTMHVHIEKDRNTPLQIVYPSSFVGH